VALASAMPTTSATSREPSPSSASTPNNGSIHSREISVRFLRKAVRPATTAHPESASLSALDPVPNGTRCSSMAAEKRHYRRSRDIFSQDPDLGIAAG
jgi:hypothetical protein